ncbi:hypothetical protein [Litchfieldia alkalitelluris]|uniref:hypothetical protein n=1 Tax=Litchfieldia alkalitelluris TaxID=304268 RepID=UPI00099776ED|nr:hypothetical protein [Litchfieldia alkalitelluris]
MSLIVQDAKTSSINNSVNFTYHKESGYIGFVWAMITVTVVETVGVSFLLYNWNPIIHWIHLLIGISVLLFLIIELKTVNKTPITLNASNLSLKIGIRPEVSLKLNNIKEIISGSINYESDKKQKNMLDLSLLGLESPSYEVILNQPIEVKSPLGIKSTVDRVFFTVDDKEAFLRTFMQSKEENIQ